MTAAIIQARTGSSRLPNKIFKLIEGKPLIYHITERVKRARLVDKVIIATTNNSADNSVEDWCNENNIAIYRGNENDVLNRYYNAAKAFDADVIVRITCDDPFKDPEIIDEVINHFLQNGCDFASNNNPPTYPEGLDVEVMSFKTLETMEQNAATEFEREHVTQYVYRNPGLFKIGNHPYFTNLSHLRWTIDTDNDLEMTRKVYAQLYPKSPFFSYKDVLKLTQQQPEITAINQNEKRSTLYN
ncbi:MAG TPA: glycosyltransferase family protein [Mucilaginibacter sp.]|nr:glycosyltransferase family protein [Mucilaginibacter sp.]